MGSKYENSIYYFDHIALARDLFKKRDTEGLTVKDVALKASMSISCMHRFENADRKSPSVLALHNVCKWLGVSMYDYIKLKPLEK